jgi:hypothetical protein
MQRAEPALTKSELVLHVALKSALDEQKHRAEMATILRR